MPETKQENPTAEIPLGFDQFLEERRRAFDEHVSPGGIADYAFGLDYTLRQRIASIAMARQVVKAVAAAVGPLQKHLHNMQMVAVNPRQFAEIYTLGEACARRLGIGIPQIFIMPSPTLAAYTFATDDIAPMLVLSSGLVDALEPRELMFVIGHECGHIHNPHGAYNMAVQNLTNPLAKLMFQQVAGLGVALDLIKTLNHLQLLAGVIAGGLKLFFLNWSRAAEVTCDRAGLICCGDLETAQMALARIATGGAASLRGINIQEFVRQLDVTRTSPTRIVEFFASHPLIPKRLEALRLFAGCQVFRNWRPDIEQPRGLPLDRAEVDARCAQVLGILSSGDGGLALAASEAGA